MNNALTRNSNTESKSTIPWHARSVPKAFVVSLTVAGLLVSISSAGADPRPKHAEGMERGHEHGRQTRTLSEQIEDLGRQVLELQAKVREEGVDPTAMKANGDKERLKMSMGMSGSATQAQGMPPNAPNGPSAQAPQMGMMAGMMGMMNSMMGGMSGMTANAPMGQGASMGPNSFLSELPGFPGASHLYHIGSTNFFFDHPQHLTLSLEQQKRIGEIRTKALLRRADFNRKIQKVEEEIWLLTAAGQPNVSNIERKIRESEKLQGDSRVAFIRDVGEAATLLSDEQRNALLGQVYYPSLPTGLHFPRLCHI